ncbi:MAG: hypothetical protein ACR2OJ_15715 [Hyphomicrobiales bacterium]
MNHKHAHVSEDEIVRAGRKLGAFAAALALFGAAAFWLSPQFRALLMQTYETMVEAMVIIAAYCT